MAELKQLSDEDLRGKVEKIINFVLANYIKPRFLIYATPDHLEVCLLSLKVVAQAGSLSSLIEDWGSYEEAMAKGGYKTGIYVAVSVPSIVDLTPIKGLKIHKPYDQLSEEDKMFVKYLDGYDKLTQAEKQEWWQSLMNVKNLSEIDVDLTRAVAPVCVVLQDNKIKILKERATDESFSNRDYFAVMADVSRELNQRKDTFALGNLLLFGKAMRPRLCSVLTELQEYMRTRDVESFEKLFPVLKQRLIESL